MCGVLLREGHDVVDLSAQSGCCVYLGGLSLGIFCGPRGSPAGVPLFPF